MRFLLPPGADAVAGWSREQLASAFRSVFTGGAEGPPAWTRELEVGDDEGYFGPDSAAWALHGNLATLVAGVRALLVQSLHPGAVTGVDEHSTYRDDPLARLDGTGRWLAITTFGSRRAADRECARVRGMHRRVRGTFVDADGQERPYRASDPRLLAWVHATFVESVLVCHRLFAGEVPGGPDAYVREWATAGELVGLQSPPRTVAELSALLVSFEPELATTPASRRTMAFLRNPPLHPGAQVGYQVCFAAAAGTLPARHLELLGLPPSGGLTARIAARGLLGGLRAVLGESSPAALAACRRIQTNGPDIGAPPAGEIDKRGA